MIERAEVMMLLLEASPSFAARWTAYLESSYSRGDEPLLYVDLGEFARHVIRSYEQGQTDELRRIFDAVERLHVEGDAYVREAATIGLLEGLQNNASHRIDPEVFSPFLGPESLKWWNELNAFWQGERRYVGEGVKNTDTNRPNKA